MKKYGKYEKRPEGVPVKQPKVKSALLQTYLTSLLCMVLCVTMFFGTSFAWFTSEVNNEGNEIHIGILDVDLQDGKGNSLDGSDQKLFDGNIRWEPGYTAIETVKVVDEGDLAFKYVLNFTDGSPADGNSVSVENIAKWFDVWVYDHQKNNGVPTTGSYQDLIAENSGWMPVGTLKNALDGKTVLEGKMDSTEALKEKTTHTYTIALHMKGEQVEEEQEDELNALMNQKLSLTVKLVAHQLASEPDDFGSSTYDELAGAVDAGEFKNTLASASGKVLMTSDVEIKELKDALTMSAAVTLDGNGKTVTYSGERSESGSSVGVLTTGGGEIRNITVNGKENGRALYITKLTGNLDVYDSTFSGAYAFNLNSAHETNYTLKFTNTTFKSWVSYANVMEHAYFNSCTFEAELRPYGDTTLSDCTFAAEKLDVSALEEGNTITLTNCTYNGVSGVDAVLTAAKESDKIVVTCNNTQLKIEGGIVILADSAQN